MQERRKSIANALELHLFCIKLQHHISSTERTCKVSQVPELVVIAFTQERLPTYGPFY